MNMAITGVGLKFEMRPLEMTATVSLGGFGVKNMRMRFEGEKFSINKWCDAIEVGFRSLRSWSSAAAWQSTHVLSTEN